MYILRIPFEIQNGVSITGLDYELNIGKLKCLIKKEAHCYVMQTSGFDSLESAENFYVNTWSGLANVTLNCGIAIDFEEDIQRADEGLDPTQTAANISKAFNIDLGNELHGIINGRSVTIFDSGKKYKTITVDKAKLTYGASSEKIAEMFSAGLSYSNKRQCFEDDKFRVALDMYRSFFVETSQNAKFLSLIMALEALTSPTPRPELITRKIAAFQNELKSMLAELPPGTEEADATQALIREVDFRKGNSIRSQIRTLVHDTLKLAGDENYLELSKRAQKIYDMRSELVHNGRIKSGNLSETTSETRTLVEKLLKAKLNMPTASN